MRPLFSLEILLFFQLEEVYVQSLRSKYRSPLISGQLMVLMCPQPVWQVHREAKSGDPQGTSGLLPPGAQWAGTAWR